MLLSYIIYSIYSNTVLNEFALKIYLPTHTRISPYIWGLLMGSILEDYKNTKEKYNLTEVCKLNIYPVLSYK